MPHPKARIHDALVSAIGLNPFGRRHNPSGGSIRINVGSGLVVAPGWVNVDAGLIFAAAALPTFILRWLFRALPSTSAARRDFAEDDFVRILSSHRFVHHRLETGLPFPDQVADHVFMSHLLEHLFLSQARVLLRDCYRVLRPGGVIRVAVPDLKHVLGLFDKDETERALGYFFHDSGPSMLTRHRYMYDATSLGRELTEAGFRSVCVRAFGQGQTPDLDLLDNRPDESVFMEGEKPG